MIRTLSIYTRNGDNGCTDTIDRKNISKSDLVIRLMGMIDELSSHLGLAKALLCGNIPSDDIEKIQGVLSLLMGELAGAKLFIGREDIILLEKMCDKYCPVFPDKFILPGKNVVSAQLDISRTVARRAEIEAVCCEIKNKNILAYLNRVSDAIYAMARYCESKESGILCSQSNAEAK